MQLLNETVSFKSFILFLATFLVGVVATTEGNTRRIHAPGKLIMEMLQEEQDAQDCFEESFIVLTEINAQRPGRIRTRFTASSNYFIVNCVTRTEEVSVKDIHVANSCVSQQQAHPLPFYYQFLFRLTPF